MFFDTFSTLCLNKGVSLNRACIEIGVSRTAVAKWKAGATPNGTTLASMARYFDASTDYLLGNSETKKESFPAGKDSRNPAIEEIAALLDKTTPAQQELALRLLRELLVSREKDTVQ